MGIINIIYNIYEINHKSIIIRTVYIIYIKRIMYIIFIIDILYEDELSILYYIR